MTRKVVLIVINSLCLGLINEIAQQRQAEKRKERINERKKERKRNETRVDILKTQHRSSVDAKNKTLVFPSGKTTKFALCTFSLILSLSSKQNTPFPNSGSFGWETIYKKGIESIWTICCNVRRMRCYDVFFHSHPFSLSPNLNHTHTNTHTRKHTHMNTLCVIDATY